MKTTEQTLRQVVRESIAAARTPLQLAAAALKRDADMGWVNPWDVDDVADWFMKHRSLMPFPDEDAGDPIADRQAAFANAREVMKAMGNDPFALDSY